MGNFAKPWTALESCHCLFKFSHPEPVSSLLPQMVSNDFYWSQFLWMEVLFLIIDPAVTSDPCVSTCAYVTGRHFTTKPLLVCPCCVGNKASFCLLLSPHPPAPIDCKHISFLCSTWAKECVRFLGSPAIVCGTWKPPPGSASILPPLSTHCFLSIILEHWVPVGQFCPQDVCLKTLPCQDSKLKTSADNPNTTRVRNGINPWAVLLMPNKVYLYSKIATGYLSFRGYKG